MTTKCYITFVDNRLKVYSAGQMLNGNVRLVLEEEKKVRGVYVRIFGEAYASIRNGKSTYTGKETYLNDKTYLVGSERGEVRLAPGEYFYNFQCMLPADLPTSCEGKVGHIRYSVNVVLDIPLWPDKEFEQLFTVIKPIDLNSFPGIRDQNIARNSHKFWPCCLMCCCPSDPLEIVARTPLGGYTPGQTVILEIDVNNRSNRTIPEFSVKLIKEIKYFNLRIDNCFFPCKQKHVDILKIREKDTVGCDAHREQNVRVIFIIPPIPPTDISTSSILKVSYFFEITGSTSFCHMKPTVKLPIVIGTYPINDGSSKSNADNQPGSNGAPKSDDPPNYEEAMYLDVMGGNQFKPLYPVFT